MRYSELIENTDDDDDLFGGRDRESLTAEKAVTKFKMFFPINKRVSWSKMHFGTVERLFGFTSDSRFHAGRAVNRNEYWGTQAYTNRQTGLGMLVYEDSGQGTWVYLGANDRNDFARMIQQMIEAGQLEDPEAAKKRRVEKQQRRAATIEKKGLRVGSIIDIGYNDIKAEVIEIKPTTGKVVMRDITGANIGTERTWSAYQLKKSQIIGEDNDDDLFATPKIAFNDVFNEYDEDQLMAQGFQYGDHPEQDIEILNDYLEDYKDFRVVDISGGEHDLVLHLDRSSKLRETNDDELFGSPALTAAKIGKLLGAAGVTSGEIVDPESVNLALHRIAALNKYRIKAEIMQQQWLNMDEDTAWNMIDDIANVVYDINGDGWEPEEDPYYDRANESTDDDDELFAQKWHERINMRSIEIDGVDRRDYPDFADAYVSYAQYKNGRPMDELELEKLNNYLIDNGKLHELVWDSLYEDRHAL